MTSKFWRYVSFIDIHTLHSKWYIASILPQKRNPWNVGIQDVMTWTPTNEHQEMSNEKKKPVCLGYTGDEILPSYVKIILNHDISILIKQPVFHGFRIRLAFCFNRGSKKIHGSRQDSWLFGYGFSYVYRRCAALAKPFPHCHFGEELDELMVILRNSPPSTTTGTARKNLKYEYNIELDLAKRKGQIPQVVFRFFCQWESWRYVNLSFVVILEVSRVFIWTVLIVMSIPEQPGWPCSLSNDEQMVATKWGWFASSSYPP